MYVPFSSASLFSIVPYYNVFPKISQKDERKSCYSVDSFYTDFITREKDAHMLESYITVKQDGFSEIEIKKSRFICSVKRVTSEEEAKAFIAAIKRTLESQS